MVVSAIARKGRPGQLDAVLGAHVSLCVVLMVLPVVVGDLWTGDEVLSFGCWLLTLASCWALCTWWVSRGVFWDPYSLFLLSAVLFHAGECFLYVFGVLRYPRIASAVSPGSAGRAFVFISSCIMAMHAGALIALRRSLRKPAPDRDGGPGVQVCALFGYVLLLVSAVPMYLVLRDFVSVTASGYFNFFSRRGNPTGGAILVVATLLRPGVMFLLVAGSVKRAARYLSLGVIAVYVLVVLFVGSRNLAITMAVPALWLYDSVIKRLNRGVLVAAAAATIVALPVIYQVRAETAESRLRVETYLRAASSSRGLAADTLAEMGGTAHAVAYSLQMVPVLRPFDYGTSYFWALTTLLPNLSGNVHPAIAHGLLSNWLIQTTNPFTARRGGTIGFSFIAEAYVNFGTLGGILSLGLLGFLLVSLLVHMERTMIGKAAVASLLSFLLFFPRAEATITLRGIVWCALIPYLAALVAVRERAKQVMQAGLQRKS